MDNITFSLQGWKDYIYWQDQDRKTLRRINLLIKELQRTPFEGIGKPEPLKGDKSGCWSRRIDDINRLIYTVENNQITIVQCRSHYGA